ncbi:MAG: mobilization protein [Methylococcaceae bacterium]|nr:mobilization protein [Methylococcaceae bacterium]MDD1616369.1 mobilization protein [Methylococcaceae bacterium]
MATIDEQIAKLEEEHKKKINQLKAKNEQLEARKLTALLKGNKSRDTRRKILAGALILDIMQKDEAAKNRFIVQLDKYLTRADDRALFDLKPLKEEEISTPKS